MATKKTNSPKKEIKKVVSNPNEIINCDECKAVNKNETIKLILCITI